MGHNQIIEIKGIEKSTKLLNRLCTSKAVILPNSVLSNRSWLPSKLISFKSQIQRLEIVSESLWRNNSIPSTNNGFMEVLEMAYSQHYPVVFSPDSIWLFICQNFSRHIENRLCLQSDLVIENKPKEKITVNVGIDPKFLKNNWKWVIEEILGRIRATANTKSFELIDSKFSTTNIEDATVFKLTALNYLEKYYDYGVEILCGIPEYILEGEVEDWEKIEFNAAKLLGDQFPNWAERLCPILAKFREAAQGEKDLEFWKSFFYKSDQPCYQHITYGYIKDFFPDQNYKTSGVIQTNFKTFNGQENRNIEIFSGFFGYTQNPNSLALKPKIGWSMIDPKLDDVESK